jgi:diguanylate cyclase (GGDEF)-like protein/PAS domain S-box-containing protein
MAIADDTVSVNPSPAEALRLATLRQYRILDTPSEPEFDRIVDLARTMFNVPIALVTLLDDSRQWFKACYGVNVQETEREIAFCDYTIRDDAVMVVHDAQQDVRFRDNPLVTGEPYIRFYAGAPLTVSNGTNLGSLCVIDTKPRASFGELQRQQLIHLAAVVVDALELRLSHKRVHDVQAEREHIASELANFFALSPDLFAIVEAGHFVRANPAWETVLGYSTDTLCEQPLMAFVHPDDRERTAAAMAQLQDEGELTDFENRYFTKSGGCRWLRWGANLDKTSGQMYAVARDITEQRDTAQKLQELNEHLEEQVAKRTEALEHANSQLYYHAFHDELTGLANRTLFLERLNKAIAACHDDPSREFAVLFLDLDRFKLINDSLGHSVGDTLLTSLAEILRDCVQPHDTVARFGGDEFTVLLSDAESMANVTSLIACIQKKLSRAFEIATYKLHTSVSIGVVMGGNNYNDAEAVVRDADTAMYRAKADGKARFAVFRDDMRQDTLNLLVLDNNLRQALLREEFVVHYQPIVTLENRRLCGFEALVRWEHPEHGTIHPGDFIPLAEETGLIHDLDRWVLRQALAQLALWRQVQPDLTMNVNLSSGQFDDKTLASYVEALVADARLEPHALKLEITENALMGSPENSVTVLEELAEHGVSLCVDDFGTGYSSLSYLQQFPVDTLKIDRVFIHQMLLGEASLELIKTITTMAHNLGMSIVAEGIEEDAQLEQLQTLGCEMGQGYLFAKPLPADEAEGLLEVD